MAILDPQYLDAIKGFEGYSPNAAWDYKQSSSGYGTVAQPGDANIPPDQLKAVHEQRYQSEIAKAASAVDNFAPNLPTGARAALVSLTYNAGPGWQQSGLGNLVRNGDLEGARAKFLEYNKAGGEVNDGLVARRAKEASWFGGPAYNAIPQQPAPMLRGQPAPQFAAPPQTQPEELEQPSYFSQMPADQTSAPPPLFAPQPKKSINLAQLKAALASGNRGFFNGKIG